MFRLSDLVFQVNIQLYYSSVSQNKLSGEIHGSRFCKYNGKVKGIWSLNIYDALVTK